MSQEGVRGELGAPSSPSEPPSIAISAETGSLLCGLHFKVCLSPPLWTLCITLSSHGWCGALGTKGLTGTETRMDKTMKGVGCHADGLKLYPVGWSLQAGGHEMIFIIIIF